MDNLTRKAIAAEKAGLSYGKYVAQMAMGEIADSELSRDGDEKAEPEMDRMGRIPCKECGELFYPLRKGNVFCSRACGDRRRSREKYRRAHGIQKRGVKRGHTL